MDTVNKNHLIRSLKISCYTFILIALVYLITAKLLYPNRKVNLIDLLMFAFASFIGSYIGYFKRYKKYCTTITVEHLSSKDIVTQLQEIMKRMHWSVQNVSSKQITFKSSFLRTFLTEYLTVNINENSLELTGPQHYVKKVIRDIGSVSKCQNL